MPLSIPVGFAQAIYSIKLDTDNEPMAITMGHDVSEAGSNYESAANDLFDLAKTALMPRVPSAYTMTKCALYVGQDGGPPAIYESSDTPYPGGQSVAAAPQNVAVLVRKRTAAAGRRARGRFYFPGVLEGAVENNGSLQSGYLGDWQTAANLWRQNCINGAGGIGPSLPQVLLHNTEGLTPAPPPTVITALVVDPVVATQRRRLRR